MLSDHGCKNIRVTTKEKMCERADWIHVAQKNDLKGGVGESCENSSDLPGFKKGQQIF